MSKQKITNAMIEAVNSSVLSGASPAVDGSALTGLVGGSMEVMTDAEVEAQMDEWHTYHNG